jgi:hypothetical protein
MLLIIELILGYFVLSIVIDLLKFGMLGILTLCEKTQHKETETERRERRAKAEEARVAEIRSTYKALAKEWEKVPAESKATPKM